MNDPETPQSPDNSPGPQSPGPKTPQGTIALLLVYLVIIIALWTNVYMTMLSRGVNQ